MSRHAIAKAHADLRAALRLTAAVNAVEAALKNERRLLEARLDDPRDQIAERGWRKACVLLAAALGRLDAVAVQFETSARLAREVVS